MAIRVLLVDNHQILLDGLRILLDSMFQIVGSATDGYEAIQKAIDLHPDVVVLEIDLPVLSGFEAAGKLREIAPELRIIFLTRHAEKSYVQKGFAAGASAYVVKHSHPSELCNAIELVMQGETYVSDQIRHLLEGQKSPMKPCSESTGITGRQRDVLQLISHGKTAKEIAAQLGISPKTVEFHKTVLSDRLGLRTIAALTRYAMEQGL